MSREEQEDNTIYKVVVNHEEQYSIWSADRENPLGWNDAGKSGPKDGMPRLHQRGLDGHAPPEPPQEDGAAATGRGLRPDGDGPERPES